MGCIGTISGPRTPRKEARGAQRPQPPALLPTTPILLRLRGADTQ